MTSAPACFRSVEVVISMEMGVATASDTELIERVDRALAVLKGKWKVHLLFSMARGVHRHARLLDSLPGTSKKVMIDTLRALERDGLVTRNVFPEVPARVEYSLTPLGWSITEPLVVLAEWAEENCVEKSCAGGGAPENAAA